MSTALCLVASLLTCPHSDTGPRLRPSAENTQSITRERLGAPPTPIAPSTPVLARFGPDERVDNLPAPIPARFGPDDRFSHPPIAAARFGPDNRFGTTEPQAPFVFSKMNEKQEVEDQGSRYKKRKKIEASSLDSPRLRLKTRPKIIVKTTETKPVQTAYVEQTPLKEQWRLSSLFGVRKAITPTLSQSISAVSGVELGRPGYQEVIRAAKIHQVPVDLALRVAKQESRGNCGVKSSAGALGVMQVMPRTGAKHGYSTKQLINCRTGAEAGVKDSNTCSAYQVGMSNRP